MIRINERQLFISVLIVVLLVHGGFLLYRFNVDHSKSVAKYFEPPKTKAIKVQILKNSRLLSDKLKQIVESEDPAEFKKPDNARFMSDKNRTFDRQTLARKVAPFQKSSQGGNGKKSISLGDLGQPAERHPLMAAARAYAKRGNKHEPQQNLGTGQGDGRATASSTSDYVEGVPLGDLTHLNTQEYKYYGFYHRIKLKLEQFWGRSIHETAEQLHRTGRRIASESSVITSLRVTLDEMGEIIAIAVIGPSGVQELDNAAIDSFNQAGPFPNPPKGMIVDGKVTLEWGFVVNS